MINLLTTAKRFSLIYSDRQIDQVFVHEHEGRQKFFLHTKTRSFDSVDDPVTLEIIGAQRYNYLDLLFLKSISKH